MTVCKSKSYRYLIESVYGMRVALKFNSGNRSLKSYGVKATQNDLDGLKFTYTIML